MCSPLKPKDGLNGAPSSERSAQRDMPGGWELALGIHPAVGFFAGFYRVASGDLLVPGGVEGPSPSFAYCAADHGLEGPGFADRALIDVDEDSAEHDEGGDVVEHVADGDGGSAEIFGSAPEDDAGDHKDDASADDLPELNFLSGIEEACIGGVHFLFAADNLLHVAHPAGVGGSPGHGAKPVEGLQSEEEDEADAEIGVHDAAERASAKDGREPAEQPWEVDTKAGEEGEEKEERDRPVNDAGVDRMAQEFSDINPGAAHGLEFLASLVVEAVDGVSGHGWLLGADLAWAPCLHGQERWRHAYGLRGRGRPRYTGYTWSTLFSGGSGCARRGPLVT